MDSEVVFSATFDQARSSEDTCQPCYDAPSNPRPRLLDGRLEMTTARLAPAKPLDGIVQLSRGRLLHL